MADKKNEIAEEMPEESLEELFAKLDQVAKEACLSVETHEMSMIDMPFAAEHFDLLWAEGSIFIIGLARGLEDFHKFIKPGGYLVFTEMCWFEADPPAVGKRVGRRRGVHRPDAPALDQPRRAGTQPQGDHR